jgi:predicted transcriptional regulator
MARPRKTESATKLIDAGLRIPPELRNRLAESAEKNCRSLNKEMEFALRQYLESTPLQDILAAYDREIKRGALITAEPGQKLADTSTNAQK